MGVSLIEFSHLANVPVKSCLYRRVYNQIKEIKIDLPNFNTFSLVLLFYIFKRLGKCIFRLGKVRSGSKGFSHYILYSLLRVN